MLALFVTAGVSSTMPKVQVYAASKKNMKSRQKSSKKTGKKNCSKVVRLANQSGEYLIDTGHNWWLKDKNGETNIVLDVADQPVKHQNKMLVIILGIGILAIGVIAILAIKRKQRK